MTADIKTRKALANCIATGNAAALKAMLAKDGSLKDCILQKGDLQGLGEAIPVLNFAITYTDAPHYQNMDLVQTLIDSGANLEPAGFIPALHHAFQHAVKNSVRGQPHTLLLDTPRVNPHVLTAEGDTIVHTAVRKFIHGRKRNDWYDDTFLVGCACKHANPNQRNKSGQTPLELVCGMAQETTNGSGGRNPDTHTFHSAITHLVEGGADPNLPLANGEIPLLHALKTSDTSMLNSLLWTGADINRVSPKPPHLSASEYIARMAANSGDLGIRVTWKVTIDEIKAKAKELAEKEYASPSVYHGLYTALNTSAPTYQTLAFAAHNAINEFFSPTRIKNHGAIACLELAHKLAAQLPIYSACNIDVAHLTRGFSLTRPANSVTVDYLRGATERSELKP